MFFLRSKPTRRAFLQTAAAATASLILPKTLAAQESPPTFWFLHSDTLESWPVADPVGWCLENAKQPILERASERLLTLTPADEQRIIRLVSRRCKLNLIELSSGRVEVHHWGPKGLADLRPLFKSHHLAREDVEVVLRDRKKEVVTRQAGDDFLFGSRLPDDWPWETYLGKWQRRYEQEPNDSSPAPGTWSGYAWEGVESNRIPWAALKSTWRRTRTPLCLNCDGPTILTNFGWPSCGMFNRCPKFLHACQKCRRSFKDVQNWMRTNLDADVQPEFIMRWGNRVKVEGRG